MRIAISLFITLLLFQVNVFAQDTTIVWKQVNNSSYSFKYPEHWGLKFEEDSKDGFTLSITHGSNSKKPAAALRVYGYDFGNINPDSIVKHRALKSYPEPSSSTTTTWNSDSTASSLTINHDQPAVSLQESEWRSSQKGKYYYSETIQQQNGKNYKMIQSLWVSGTFIYELDFYDTEGTVDEYRPILDKIIQSFAFKNK